MAIYKCKMCGGSLEVSGESSVATCEYCGSVQTLPKKNDEVITNLFNRANNLRIKCEFDKAADVYEKILNEDNKDSEAHWGLVLCKYGIEYVEDPKTYKRIPTCHRTQYESILTDVDYLAAMSNADAVSADVYKTQAEEIANLQKDILAIVKNERPFDVFICYKETDENGKRTVDSTLANDIYYQLTQEGMKVFYAAITLEDKLGVEYEPYIFAALNSAKVMLVVGTKPEYFEAIWVKNEWSRYLKLMKEDRSKILIPCYRDMDAYDLPEEFSHLQAQDMSKIGFVNDVVRGIKKVVKADEPKVETVVKETVVASDNTNIAPLLKRAFMFLEDGDWQSADEYCEKVLDINPECAEAYLGKLMADQNVRKRDELKECNLPFDNSANYQKAVRFGGTELKKELEGYIKIINGRNEEQRLTTLYKNFVTLMNSAKTEQDFKTAAASFRTIKKYRDSADLAEKCEEKAEITRKDTKLASAKNKMNYLLVDYYEEAIELLKSIPGWKDADELVVKCEETLVEIKEKAESDRIERERKAQAERIKADKHKKMIKKISLIAVAVVASIIAIFLLIHNVIIPSIHYSKAEKLLINGEYEAAMDSFLEMDFADSYDRYCEAFANLKNTYRKKGDEYLAAGDKNNAAVWYRKSGDIELANSICNLGSLVYVDKYTTAGIMADGTVKFQSDDEDIDVNEKLASLKDAVAFIPGSSNAINSNGYVIPSRSYTKAYNNVVNALFNSTKQNDKYIYYAVMLLDDGTVKVEADTADVNLYPELSDWKDIERIGRDYITVNGVTYYYIYGYDKNDSFYQVFEKDTVPEKYKLSALGNVKKVITVSDNYILLLSDGNLAFRGDASYYEEILLEKSNVQDVLDLGVLSGFLILYNDGRVEHVYNSKFITPESAEAYGVISTTLDEWNGIVSIQNCENAFWGIRYDGTIKYLNPYMYLFKGIDYDDERRLYNSLGSYMESDSWNDIVFVSSVYHVTNEGDKWIYAIGIKLDGTVVSTGNGKYYIKEIKKKETVYSGDMVITIPLETDYIAKQDGTYHNVSDWNLW